MTPKGEHRFPEINKARHGESLPFRPLFLPRYLHTPNEHLEGPELCRGYEIISERADLGFSGKLEEMKYTSYVCGLTQYKESLSRVVKLKRGCNG